MRSKCEILEQKIKQSGCEKEVQFLNYLRRIGFPISPPLEGQGGGSLTFFGMLGKSVIMQIITHESNHKKYDDTSKEEIRIITRILKRKLLRAYGGCLGSQRRRRA